MSQHGMPERVPVVGPYRLVRRRGAGGMGVVYLGHDLRTGAAAAVKLIRPEYAADPQLRVRIRREVAAARRVPRFCTAPVLDADLDGDPPWLATEYVDGPDLDTVLVQQGSLVGTAGESLAVGLAIALRAIHQHGVIHRDLKPSNVLLSPVGPRVIDFGIARIEDEPHLTQTGVVIGTPAFMAPEQLRQEPVTAAVDVFAWAGLVTCAATGRRPFGTGPPALRQILSGEPDLGDLPEPLRSLVAAAFAKDPAARPTAAELVDRLTGIAPATVSQVIATAAAVPTVPSPPPPVPAYASAPPEYPPRVTAARSRRWPWLAAAATALAVLAAVSVTAVLLTGGAPLRPGAGSGSFEGTLTLGGLLPADGPVPETWAGAVAAAKLAVADINAAGGVWGSDVEWVLADTWSAGEDRIRAAASTLIARDVHAVIGPVSASSGPSRAVIETMREERIITVSPAASEPEPAGEYFFRTAASGAVEGQVMADLIIADGHASLGILVQRGGYGEGLAEVIDQRYAAAGGQVVHHGFDDQPGEIAALVEADPEALVLVSALPEVETVIRALREAGFTAQDAQWYVVGGGVAEYALPVLSPDTLAGVKGTQRIVEEPPEELVVRVEEFAGGVPQHWYLAESYDAVMVVALAAIAAGSDDPAAIRDEMVAVTTGGTRCVEFVECRRLLDRGEDIDYDGYGGLDWNERGEPTGTAIRVVRYRDDNTFEQIEVVTG